MFRKLAEGDIHLKGPGDYVTEADLASERALTARLREIRDIPVVGEEASAADPSLPDRLGEVPAAWVVDPIDGTAHFVKGSPTYGVMVALVENGESVAGWILHPETGNLYAASRGEGATLNGEKLPLREYPRANISELRFAAPLTYAPPVIADHLRSVSDQFGAFPNTRMCAAFDYIDLINGDVDVLMFFRTKAWDHAPGAAIVRECGFEAKRLDGSEYTPAIQGEPLLLAHRNTWEAVRDVVTPPPGH